MQQPDPQPAQQPVAAPPAPELEVLSLPEEATPATAPAESQSTPPSSTVAPQGRRVQWLLDHSTTVIGALVTLATLISCFSAVVVVPEVRTWFRLDQPAPIITNPTTAANVPLVIGVTMVIPTTAPAAQAEQAPPTSESLYETTQQTVVLQTEPQGSAGQPPVVAQGQQSYRTIATSDGFVAVRAQPSTQSAETRRLAPGSLVACTGVVVGEWIDGANQWADCPSAGGFIFLPLLAPANAAPPPPPASAAACDTAVVEGVAELSIRAETNRESGLLGTVPAGGVVEVLCGDAVAADERTWVRVRAGGVEGWMSTRYLRIGNLGNQQPASDVCTTATVVEVTALAIKDTTNRNATTIGEVGQGGTVDVLCRDAVAADERTWVYVRAGGVEGWMSTRYLRFPN